MLADGSIAVVSEAWKTYDDASYGEHSAILSISHDGGYTFEPSVVVAHDPANRLLFWDERLAVDPDSGRLVGMFWTHDRVAAAGLQRAHRLVEDARWHDRGPIRSTPDSPGKSRGRWSFPGGRVLCVYVHRHWPPSLRADAQPRFRADVGCGE